MSAEKDAACTELAQWLTLHAVPAVFVREHDVILQAEPFFATPRTRPWTFAHRERFVHAWERHFIHSARFVATGQITQSLYESCTHALRYRLDIHHCMPSAANSSPCLVLTCAPNAHLALANLLERSSLFAVELLGRVVAFE